MIGLVVDIGPGLVAVCSPLAVAVAAWLGARRSTKELRPNHGSSIKDTIDRIEARQVAHGERLDAIDGRLDALESA